MQDQPTESSDRSHAGDEQDLHRTSNVEARQAVQGATRDNQCQEPCAGQAMWKQGKQCREPLVTISAMRRVSNVQGATRDNQCHEPGAGQAMWNQDKQCREPLVTISAMSQAQDKQCGSKASSAGNHS
ncbi:hypothetical protein NDU88_005526 [Pleurodeles waltl]|uniref:Uncharacterized protein n=1 Tax=Pleurodeles waltl TaxID=8319 RepID=A0AAV7LLE1_PLEWA|nr:hypothetical protein NDU88_005526 [Pleurodeles waltl]